ncbi:MAG: ribonuclease PH [Psychrilyobacter sp.]|nr:ribonuclease PH [Psychrilyobacter sp.]
MREDNRTNSDLRDVKITTGFTIHAEGSVLIEMGNTKVICTASVSERVPRFLKKTGKGWLSAEYSMLPRATEDRNRREASMGKLGGRTMEIQRLIGRSLRASLDMKKLGERSITIDCDVIQADGGTRTASITGGYVALAIAINKLIKTGKLEESPLVSNIAAISVGVVKGTPMLDLKYTEDASADVDMNVIMDSNLKFVEVQGTGEETTFTRKELNELLDLSEKGIEELFVMQDEAIARG